MKYQILITYPDGKQAYLMHHDKTQFCKRTAIKYLHQWIAKNDEPAIMVPA